MGLIKRLDSHTINQIAAGEVVERPASIVKELMENAFDAQASRIDIELQEGGKEKIAIVDNGMGMEEVDLALSIERHATSKIASASDLLSIATLGFRGEALPSIASVSRLEITTRRKELDQGYRLRVEGGTVFPIERVGTAPGTKVYVEDLFYNTPARKKFLRSSAAESAACGEVIHRLALSHPHIALSLRQGKQITFRTAGNNKTIEVISSVYGKEPLEYLLEIDETMTETGWRLHGYIGQPALNRPNRNHQNWFVNGRWIRCLALTKALEEAYEGTLPLHRFPFYVLYLTIPSEHLDVNAHPTKQEIKFNREKEISRFIYDKIYQRLQQRSLARPLWSTKTELPSIKTQSKSSYPVGSYQEVSPQEKSFSEARDKPFPERPVEPYLSFEQKDNKNHKKEIILREKAIDFYKESNDAMKTLEIAQGSKESAPATLDPALSQQQEQITLKAEQIQKWIPLAQFRSSYIIAEAEEGLYIIDQHAAHERVLYHQLVKKAESSTEQKESQQLLLPQSLSFTPMEFQTLLENLELLRDVGFILEHFGGYTFLVRAVPVTLPIGEEESYLRQFISKVMNGSARDRRWVHKAALESLACQSAVKAGQRLSYSEMTSLLQALAQLEGTDTCPHGRPYLIRIGLKELEGKFHRT
ncbi:DNA mismatch repair endonuclease MutL [Heliorestis convoluta]|uniref:DNA mismatch repair protein MutL n=1 Tax=Heliorestis convoluta TaxID=356322 RepID=A0A5Q2MWG6_9FIRM|nr:DNA mismatch repair endonuclease MutL [Heliorestis convoluta]QGG46824.1 DNA mismatch repair protein MutL [Heliorestis convoluta]